MASYKMSQDNESPTCSLSFMDCLASKPNQRNIHSRLSSRIGVEREMCVTHSQPHLVPPMKLTVYDDMPTTPASARPVPTSPWSFPVRDAISRASTRASVTSVTRRRLVKKSLIATPRLAQQLEVVPLRRNPSFRPLQLSIYFANNRLSDLPEFDQFSFSETGEIRLPPRALVRTQSEDILRNRAIELDESINEDLVLVPQVQKPASMYEQASSHSRSHSRPRTSQSYRAHLRRDTSSTIMSTSRPASEYDALHSHPVSFLNLPGLPPQIATASQANQRKALTPMQEEFCGTSPLPTSTSVCIDGTTLVFPEVEARRTLAERSHSYLLPPAECQQGQGSAPSPVIDPGPNRRVFVQGSGHKSQKSEAASFAQASVTDNIAATAEEPVPVPTVDVTTEQAQFSHSSDTKNKRITAWLDSDSSVLQSPSDLQSTALDHTRSRDSSISTVKSAFTSSTTSSFAEHRRKRSQFYQLNTKAASEGANGRPATAGSDNSSPASAGSQRSAYTFPPTPLKLYKPFPNSLGIAVGPKQNSSTPSQPQHGRNNTESTVASSIATDILFSDDGQERDRDEVGSTTTYDMASRTGTMKSYASGYTHASTRKPRTKAPAIFVTKEEAEPTDSAVSIMKKFKITDSLPDVSSQREQNMSPTSQANAVEDYMHELCGQAGYRRINVGVAF